jgi:hypothetical protein
MHVCMYVCLSYPVPPTRERCSYKVTPRAHTYIHTYIHTYKHTHARYIYIHTHAYIYIYIYVYMYVCMYIQTHTHTHITHQHPPTSITHTKSLQVPIHPLSLVPCRSCIHTNELLIYIQIMWETTSGARKYVHML